MPSTSYTFLLHYFNETSARTEPPQKHNCCPEKQRLNPPLLCRTNPNPIFMKDFIEFVRISVETMTSSALDKALGNQGGIYRWSKVDCYICFELSYCAPIVCGIFPRLFSKQWMRFAQGCRSGSPSIVLDIRSKLGFHSLIMITIRLNHSGKSIKSSEYAPVTFSKPQTFRSGWRRKLVSFGFNTPFKEHLQSF